jgi:hypothetical protein
MRRSSSPPLQDSTPEPAPRAATQPLGSDQRAEQRRPTQWTAPTRCPGVSREGLDSRPAPRPATGAESQLGCSRGTSSRHAQMRWSSCRIRLQDADQPPLGPDHCHGTGPTRACRASRVSRGNIGVSCRGTSCADHVVQRRRIRLPGPAPRTTDQACSAPTTCHGTGPTSGPGVLPRFTWNISGRMSGRHAPIR